MPRKRPPKRLRQFVTVERLLLGLTLEKDSDAGAFSKKAA